MKIDNIVTKRCLVREICLKDTPKIVEWRNDPEVYKYFKNPIKLDIDNHVKWFNESYLANPDRIDFVALLKDSFEPIGSFHINKINNDSAEVSYLLDYHFRGKGYASEILLALEDIFYKKWNVSIFVAEIHKENTNSLYFIEKMGYMRINEKGNFLIYQLKK